MVCHLKKILLIIFIAIISSACATIKPLGKVTTKTEHIYNTNYTIGEITKAYVGEEMVKVEDYWIKKVSQNKIKALNGFKAGVGFFSFRGSEGELFNLAGVTTKSNGEEVYAVLFPDRTYYANAKFCITKGGFWANHIINVDNSINLNSGYIEPKDTRFVLLEVEEIDSTKGYTNFEIVFSGISSDSINLLYREYTSDNMARPAYYQSLTYPLETEFIRFKKIQIKVIEATSQAISYLVLEDGISGSSNS